MFSWEHIRHCMLYEYQLGTSAPETVKRICLAYGQFSLSPSSCYYWFSRFQSGNFDLTDHPKVDKKPNTPEEKPEFDFDGLISLMETEPCLSTKKLAKKLGYTKPTLLEHLKKINPREPITIKVPEPKQNKFKSLDLNILRGLLEGEPDQSTKTLAKKLNTDCVTVALHLKLINDIQSGKLNPNPKRRPRVDDEAIISLIQADPGQTNIELAKKLGCDRKTVGVRLKKLRAKNPENFAAKLNRPKEELYNETSYFQLPHGAFSGTLGSG